MARNKRNWQDWADPGERGEAAFNGIDSVPGLLAFCLIRGAPLLHADDVARLNASELGDTASLRWRVASTLAELERITDAWADRGTRERYRLGTAQRTSVATCLGPEVWNDGRALILIAAHLGRSFLSFAEDYAHPDVARIAEAAGVVPAPQSFLSEAANLPPPPGTCRAAGWNHAIASDHSRTIGVSLTAIVNTISGSTAGCTRACPP